MSRKRRSKGVGTVRDRGKPSDGPNRAWLLRTTWAGRTYSKTVRAATKSGALTLLAAFITEVRSGAFAQKKEERQRLSEQPTLAEFAPIFLSSHVTQDPDRAATRTAYGNMLRLYIVPALGSYKLSAITAAMIRESMQDLYRRGRAIGTLKLVFAVLHRCLDAAIDDGYLKESPVPKFSKLRLGEGDGASESAKRHALSAAEVTALIGACDDPAIRLWVSIMASCGLRPGEANALRWQDVDITRGELRVCGAAKKVYGPAPGAGARIWIGKTKTKSSQRDLTMGPMLAALFVAERQRQEGEQRMMRGLPSNVTPARPLLPDDACVFCADPATLEGLRRPRSPDNLSWQFRRAARRAGLAHVSPHWLRHTAISHAIAEGTPLADASRRAGHKSPAITAAIYTHAVGAGEMKAARIGDSLLAPAATGTVERIGAHKGQD